MSSQRDSSVSKPSNKLIALLESYKDSNPDNAIPGRIVSVQAFNGVSMEDILQKWTESSFPQLLQFQQKDALGDLFSSKCALDGKTKEVTIRFSPEGDDARFSNEGVIPPFFFWIDKPSVLSLPDHCYRAGHSALDHRVVNVRIACRSEKLLIGFNSKLCPRTSSAILLWCQSY